jgi:hypothetical protein
MRILRIVLAAALVLLVVALVSACDDGSDSPRPVRSVEVPTDDASPTGVGALPLDRFIYDASLTLRSGGGEDAKELFVSTRGIYVAPDRNTFTYTTRLGDGKSVQRLVQIGDDVWYRDGDDPWEKLDPEDERVTNLLAVAFTALKPDFLGGPEFDRVRANVLTLTSTEEFVNAIRTDHYQVGVEGRQYLEALQVGDEDLRSANDLTWDLWLAQDGQWPVRLQATGTVAVDLTVLQTLELEAPTQWEIKVDIEHPDDPELAVNPPEEG